MFVGLNVYKPGFARPGVCVPGAKRVLILLVTTPTKGESHTFIFFTDLIVDILLLPWIIFKTSILFAVIL